MSKKIIRIRDKIKKSFLYISSASFRIEVGKHSTVKYSLYELYQVLFNTARHFERPCKKAIFMVLCICQGNLHKIKRIHLIA